MRQRIDDFLSASQSAQRLAHLSLGQGRQLAIWQNSYDEVEYKATKGHAYSLYLKGGLGTRRIDGGPKRGEPGSLCILPDGHSSSWDIAEPFQFIHLYVTDDVLRAAFARIHDQDARRLDISERTFVAPDNLDKPLRRMAQAVLDGDVLAADVGFSEMVASLNHRQIHLSGGLSQKVQRDVMEWVDANLDRPILLSDLAKLAGLSEFHFHRMFRQSQGIPPHKWLMQTRIARAKALLATLPMSEVSVACGFSSQSHFVRSFKQQIDVTPGQYLRLMTS